MRVNIIGNLRKNTGVSQDIEILHGIVAHVYGKETQVCYVPHYHPHCPQAELNFFVEVINPALFMYAAKNIWVPNPEWTYKTWEPYSRMVDEVWVKTREAEKLFQDWGCNVRYVGWTSIDKGMPEKKNFWKALVPVGKNIWRNPKPIIQAYLKIQRNDPHFFQNLPELHIVHVPEAVSIPPIPENIQSKVKIHSGVMDEKEYDELVQECGLCICMSATEGFGHAVNEAMSTGSLLILSPIDAFMELAHEVLWVSNSKVIPHPQCLGKLEDVEVDSIIDSLSVYTTSNFHWKSSKSKIVRSEYESRHALFMKNMETALLSLQNTPQYSLENLMPKEDSLPSVSIITITRDRRPFIPLAKYCFLAQAYPEDKLEWVIVDDGKDQIKDLVSDLPNVKYVLVDEPLSIGAKRNLAVEKASHDILVMMDDDDVYPNNSVVTRVAYMLAEPKKECVFSTTIPCYEIHDSKSFMNVPPITLPMSQRVSEATLCFTRDFWKQRGFPDKQVAEGESFLQGRETKCREVSPQDVIVSLIHKKNTSSRKPPQMEPNGCHYGFADQLFTLVSEIGLSLQ
jgi:Glycosyl transferase family 2